MLLCLADNNAAVSFLHFVSLHFGEGSSKSSGNYCIDAVLYMYRRPFLSAFTVYMSSALQHH